MKAVYLDQNHWIALAQAKIDHPLGIQHKKTLDSLTKQVEQKNIIVPISIIHILEVLLVAKPERREKLAEMMLDLSQGYFISNFLHVFPLEIANAISISLTGEEVCFKESIIGQSLDYAFGDEFVIEPPEMANKLKAVLNARDSIELIITWDYGDKYRIDMRKGEEDAADVLNSMRNNARKEGISKAVLLDGAQRDFMKERYIPELTKNIQMMISESNHIEGADPKSISDMIFSNLSEPKPGSLEAMMNCPSIYTYLSLSVERDHAWDRKVTGNDMRDIAFLSIAIPYCDIVVTENYFGNMAIRLGLNSKYDCHVLTKLDQLVDTIDNEL